MSPQPIRYLDNPNIANKINASPEFLKSAKTLLRRPSSDEIGTEIKTYVVDNNTTRIEAINIITKDKVVARNPGPSIGEVGNESVFNEWLIDRDVAIKNYGEDVVNGLGNEFSIHQKKGAIRALQLDADTMRQLGVEGDTLKISVDWSPEPMEAKIGDWLTSGGYSISENDFSNTYTPKSNENEFKTKIMEKRIETASMQTNAPSNTSKLNSSP